MNGQMTAVQARYRDTGVKRYAGNPLIEALPPIWSPDQAEKLLSWAPPKPTKKDRKKAAHLRVHEVPELRRFVHPLPEYRMYQSIFSILIRDGLVTRNPMSVRTLQYLHELNLDQPDGLYPPEPLEHRASGIIFAGLSGLGKSTFIDRLLAGYPQSIQHTQYKDRSFQQLQIVWLKISCPHDGSLKGLVQRFFVAVDEVIGSSYAKSYFPKAGRSPSLPTLLGEMRRIAANYFLCVLVIDELQNLNRARTGGDQGMLEFLGNMVDEIGVPVITIGTPAITKLFKSEMRTPRRMASIGYYEFQRPGPDDAQWIEFMTALWKYQWTDTDVVLTPELRHRFYEYTQGITALAIAMFVLAQFRCLLEQAVLDESLLEEISLFELAPVQRALKVLRSNSPELYKDFDDLMPAVGWLDDLFDPNAAALRATANKETPATNPRRPPTDNNTPPKGKSAPSSDPNDLRNLGNDAKEAHDRLRELGLTPTNAFKFTAGAETTEKDPVVTNFDANKRKARSKSTKDT